jgi:5-methylcytosine-specific restriction endonuclease McrA
MTQESERREAVRNDWTRYRPKRGRVSSKLRRIAKAMIAGNPLCYTCGNAPATEVDHIRPVCMGGTDEPDNLAPICRPCHLSKSGREANHMRWHVHKIGPRKQGAANA